MIMISVIIPFYNNNKTIIKSASSALSNEGAELEVLVVEDGKTMDDEVRKSLSRLGEEYGKTLRVITLEKNRGAWNARNVGVENAEGEYVAFLDADDWWSNLKLKEQLRVMEHFTIKGRAPSIVFSGRELYDEDGNDLGKYIHAKKAVGYRGLLKSNIINCSSVLLRRETALKYPMKEGKLHEDYLCWLEILRDGGFAAGIDKPHLCYRVSTKSKSGNKLKSAVMTARVYKKAGLTFPERMIYMCSYAYNGFKKYN